MPKIIYGEQGDERWHNLRIASIGGTAIGKIAPRGTAYKDMVYKFAGEYLSGVKSKSPKFKYADRGHEYEPVARIEYEMVTGISVEQVAMVQSDTPHQHYSPDGLSETGILEVKVRTPAEWLKLAEGKSPPITDLRQCFWGLHVCQRPWVDYINYCPELHNKGRKFILIKRINKNESELLIEELKTVADDFIKDMLELVNKYKTAS